MAEQDSILAKPIEALHGVGPTRAKHFRSLGVNTLGDLLEYFPHRYQIESPERGIADLVEGEIQSARGEVVAVDYIASRPRPRFEATISDGKESLALVWFNGAYLRRAIHPGMQIRVRAKVAFFRGIPQMGNPKWEVVDDQTPAVETDLFRPIYSASAQLPTDVIAGVVVKNIEEALSALPEIVPPILLSRRNLLHRADAYRKMHFPENHKEAQEARHRLVYDELVLLQLGLGLSKRVREGRLSAPILRADKLLDQRIRARFPFSLTTGQQNSIWEIVRDMQSGHPMNRLLQGDVGSGKTVVALYAMLVAVANKMQAAILAPTEVLAEQHFLTLTNMLRDSNVRIDLFTQRSKKKDRERLLRQLSEGEINLAVGTQALIQDDIKFANLGVVVVDEQHRLGVKQRAILKDMGHSPHYLVMTATPIPRTLALSYFADFDLSVIDELPPGRQPIRTRWLRSGDTLKAYEFIRAQIEQGRQAYIVLPQIDDSGLPDEDSKSVVKEFKRLTEGPLNGLRLAMLHGQMKPEDKQQIMSDFRAHKSDVLVATTVIEVGVDVSNATVMLIDGADRFGLSQLHQLRGRVGRGKHESHCIVLSDATSENAVERLQSFTRTSDGFEIAEKDLELRGPGAFFGTRQHGLPEMKLADISQEMELLAVARNDAQEILASDPGLSRAEHRALRQALRAQFGDSLGLASVG